MDGGTEFFYIAENPPAQCLDNQKALYVFDQLSTELGYLVLFLDKFGIEWQVKLESEMVRFSFQGKPIVKGKGVMLEASTSSITYRAPAFLAMPSPSIHTVQMPASKVSPHIPKVSFQGMPGTTGFRLEGSGPTHTMGGYPVARVPTEPPTTTPKTNLPPKTVMLYIWLDWKGVLYYELLQENQRINSQQIFLPVRPTERSTR